jgi:HSP20 family protein
MAGWPSVTIAPDLGADLADELRRIFQELDGGPGVQAGAPSHECSPVVDVLETEETVEIVMDMPGVPIDRVRVVARGDVIVIAGEKPQLPPPGWALGSYHLLERSFGRFARAVRVTRAVDGARARASLVAGELRLVLPKMYERRGRTRTIRVEQAPLPHDC